MANKPDNDLGIGCIVVILLVVGGVFEFLRSYWQIVLILAGTGAFVYFIFSGKEPEKKFIAENMKYEIKEGDTQLPSMPYSSVKPDEKIISEAREKAQEILDKAERDARNIVADAEQKLYKLNRKIENRERTIEEMAAEGARLAEQRSKEASQKLSRMQYEIDNLAERYQEAERLNKEIVSLEKKASNLQIKVDLLMRTRKAVNEAVQKYKKNFPILPDETIDLSLYLINEVESLAPSVMLKLHSMDYKDLRRAFRDNDKLIDETTLRYEGRYMTKTNRAIYRLMVIGLRAELQNILYTLTFTKLEDGLAAVRAIANKYLNIARDGNQTISSTVAKFIGEMEMLFIDAVKIEYEYYVKREAARQEQIELRAKMREEAEEQRRLREQQEQMEREESKFNAEIEKLLEQAQTVEGEKNQALLDKIKTLELQLAELSEKKDEIARLQNGKAGYVYVISNLGSFGADVFKVGMTRRLNPQERIDELGSASVPFKFDVHSFIFSEDAVKLESDLHAALDRRRLNKVNLRKEFFKVPIDELERIVEEIDPAAEFNRTMQAEQYYQSLSGEI